MIRAIALATETSHVVGTVELAATPWGLRLVFVRASGYAAAYAPTPPAKNRGIVVPWSQVTEASDDGDALRLHIDSPVVPHHRLILTHMSRDRGFDHTSVAKRRVRGELAVAGGAAVLVAVVVPLASELGAKTAAMVAALTTFSAVTAALVWGQGVSRRLMVGGAPHADERRLFLAEVQRHLSPGRVLADDALSPPVLDAPLASPAAARAAQAGEPRGRFSFGELGPVFAGAVVAAVIGLLGLSVASRWQSADPAREQAPAAVASREPEKPKEARALVPTPGDACVCEVPFAAAIPQGVPRISLLSNVVRTSPDPKRPSIVVEVAAVNNAKDAARQIAGAVTFLASPARVGEPDRVIRDRGFFYEGHLASGAAVKWRIGGRGAGYRTTVAGDDVIGTDDLASADAFAKLLSAHTRSVRIHGAAMLARSRDDRAKAAIEKLREEGEDARLTSIARATEPVLTCDLQVKNGRASACLVNTEDAVRGPLRVTLVVSKRADADSPPIARVVLAEGLVLGARSGLRLDLDKPLPEESPDTLRDVVIEAITPGQ